MGAGGGLLGGVCGILGFIEPNAAGGGFGLIPIAAAGNFSVGLLLFMFISRVITTVLCFSSGAPGGIFARCWRWERCWVRRSGWRRRQASRPTIWMRERLRLREWGRCWRPPACAMTGIVLVLEMTDNYQLILPMIITCLGATLLAQFTGGKPLYSTILARTTAKQEAEQALKQNT